MGSTGLCRMQSQLMAKSQWHPVQSAYCISVQEIQTFRCAVVILHSGLLHPIEFIYCCQTGLMTPDSGVLLHQCKQI